MSRDLPWSTSVTWKNALMESPDWQSACGVLIASPNLMVMTREDDSKQEKAGASTSVGCTLSCYFQTGQFWELVSISFGSVEVCIRGQYKRTPCGLKPQESSQTSGWQQEHGAVRGRAQDSPHQCFLWPCLRFLSSTKALPRH